jgi:hypothetical protein
MIYDHLPDISGCSVFLVKLASGFARFLNLITFLVITFARTFTTMWCFLCAFFQTFFIYQTSAGRVFATRFSCHIYIMYILYVLLNILSICGSGDDIMLV